MKDINVNILVHERSEFLDMLVWSLKQIEHKKRVKVNLLSSGINISRDMRAREELKSNGVNAELYAFNQAAPYNFMEKIKWMVNQPEPYIIRVDDDCFAPPATWDALIDSTTLLGEFNDPLAIAPCVSNGLPSVDYFRTSFLTPEQRNKLDQLILKNPVLHKWTNDYSNLAPAFVGETWNPDLYYTLLHQIDDDRLGVHPVRFNLEAQSFINDCVLDRWEEFMNPPCENIESTLPNVRPYYCNTCFAIKTDVYKTIVDDKSLERDAFEEISFNLYRRKNNLALVFLTDAWMLNFYYRSVGNLTLERKLHHKIQEKLGLE